MPKKGDIPLFDFAKSGMSLFFGMSPFPRLALPFATLQNGTLA